MPLLAVVAVALCTAMVLIVWSVMGGFLNSFLASGRQMIGDVTIASGQGIPYYESLIEDLERHPDIERATPVIETLGLVSLPLGDSRDVIVVGIDPEGYHAVTGFHDRLYWRNREPDDKDRARQLERERRLQDPQDTLVDLPPQDYRLLLPEGFEVFGEQLLVGDPDAPAGEGWRPAAVMGMRVSPYNRASDQGFFFPEQVSAFMPDRSITLRVVPLNRRGGFTTAGTVDREFPVANEFVSGLFQVDSKWVIIPLEELQQMLRMNATDRVDPNFRPGVTLDENGELLLSEPPVIGVSPARVTSVLVRARDGVSADAIEPTVKAIYANFADRYPKGGADSPPSAEWMRNHGIYTWRNKPGLAEFIRQVESETVLILFLFAVISLVAVVLIFAIFWAMVSEKTKDVGILRSIGGSKLGIAWLFLRYGMIIGVLGAAIGGTIALIVVNNINPIHEWLTKVTGRAIWDPAFYLFSRIPDDIEPTKAAIVLISAVICSVLGALIPAVRAANMDPVRALRFE